MKNELNSKGKCLIFSAPSGAGKTTIVRNLLEANEKLAFSISACSRSPRPNEKNGVDYHFLSLEDFKSKIDNNEFVEWEEVYKDNFYGTLKSEVQRIWNNDKVVVFDVDVFGGINLKKYFGNQALSIFIQPPSVSELERRLVNRQTEASDVIKMRVEKAGIEIEQASNFDVSIINDDLSTAISDTKKLVDEFISN